MRWRVAALALALALAPGAARAHLVGVEFGDFYAGALHLATSPSDVALLLALAVLAGLQMRERARWVLLALPLGLAAGVATAAAGAVLPPLQPLNAGGLAVGGLLAALAVPLPAWALAAFAAVAGHVIGAENGLAGREGGVDWWLFASGVTVTGTVVGTLAVAGAAALADWRSWVRLGQRVLGSWFAAVGAMVLGLAVAGS